MIVTSRRRLNPELPEAKLAAAIGEVERAFGLSWLEQSQDNPLATLWSRTDFLATNQLFWLGTNIAALAATDPEWVTRHIRKIKRGERNERVGSMFEIVGLALFTPAGQSVALGPNSAEGYDGDVALSDGSIHRLSLKNFGASSRQREFDRRAAAVYRHLLQCMERNRLTWAGLIMVAMRYPSDADWQALTRWIDAKAATGDLFSNTMWTLGNWSITTHGAQPSEAPLHKSRTSHMFRVFVPHHQSEYRNFVNRLAREIARFSRCPRAPGPNDRKAIFIRLSEAESLLDHNAWVRRYWDEVEQTDVDAVWFYQPTVASDLTNDTTGIFHHLSIITKKPATYVPVNMHVPVGIASRTPPEPCVMVGNGQRVSLAGHHWFQSGEIYRIYPFDGESVAANSRSLAGLHEHGIIRFPDGNEMELQRPWPPSYRLDLFD